MSVKSVNFIIDGQTLSAAQGTTIFEAAKNIGINIPHLCYHEKLSIYGACRVCVVEIEGRPRLEPSCATLVEEGMAVRTNNSRIRRARRMIVELLLANHPEDCFTCD
ncbi:MAG: 2Fe-2S iron-sulfur cluster-binding protein, partial [Candidatus Omnitrophota bacterium]|nr:2Fe-2S iron-sulfur cluster-binding protein [Candidatus Omnitrophota bacterium]